MMETLSQVEEMIELSDYGKILCKYSFIYFIPSMGKCNSIKGHVGSIRSLSFSKDSGIIVSSSDDKTIKGWNVPKNKFLFSLPGHTNWVRSSKISPDARLVVSGSDDSTVRLWDVTNS